ncbi:MAG: hypothetical protein JSV08_03930 [Acidobacteriota bacterium]|nr:MAG: hypothetical protein JSV08_03930 [Acidobacteriota bacterium]
MTSLLLLRFAIFRNAVWPLRWTTALKAGAIGFFGLAFMAALYLASVRVFEYLLSFPDFSPFFVLGFAERLLAMVYLFVFSMLLFSNLTASLSSQYLANDLVLLHALPLGRVKIFQEKFWETALSASYVAVVFPLPILLALGKVFHGGPEYYLALPLVLLLFAVAPSALGALGTLFLMRVLPAEKTSRLLGVLGLAAGIAVALAIRFMRPEEIFATEDTDEIRELLQRVALPAVPYLPSTWAARASMSFLEGTAGESLLPLLWLAALAAAAWGVLTLVASRLYFRAWETANLTEHITHRVKRTPGARTLRRMLKGFHPHTAALLWKDSVSFFRDSAQWSQLALLAALVVIYLYNLANLPFPNPILRDALSFANVGMAGFVLAAVAARFVYPAVSIEGRAVWLLYAAPLRLGRVLWNKCLTAFVPLFGLSLVIVTLSNWILEVDRYMAVLSVGMLFFITLALTGLGIGMGAAAPQFDAESAARVAVSGGALLYITASLAYVALSMALAARPVYFHFIRSSYGWEYSAAAWAHYALFIVLSLGLFVAPLLWGARRLAEHEA